MTGKPGLCLAALTFLSLSISTAQAQESASEAIRRRIERLEQQNQELQQRLETGAETANLEQGEVSSQQVQKIVADYLKEADKKKKADDDARKKQLADEGAEVGTETALTAKFNNGVHFATSDGAFKAALRGRWQMDWGWANQDDPAFTQAYGEPLDDGVLFRRGRLGLQGTVWEVCDFVANVDFAVGSVGSVTTAGTSTSNITLNGVGFREMWFGVRELPVIENFRAGHFKRVHGLEHMTSSRYLTFIERNICNEALNEEYEPGLLISRAFADERVTLAAGLYQFAPDTAPIGLPDDSNYTGVARVTALPLWQNNGRQLVHLGGSYGYGHDGIGDNPGPKFSGRNFQARPYRIDAVALAGTGNLFYDGRELIVGEFATVLGPLSIQAEYYYNQISNAAIANTNDPASQRGDVDFSGYYIFVSYFLTGENRVFSRLPSAGASSPSFTRQLVYEPFFFVRRGEKGCGGCCCGKGAWEVAARYGRLDLDNGGVFGGELQQFTLGLNWYWNPNMKIQWNLEHLIANRGVNALGATTITAPTSFIDLDPTTLVMRFAWDF